MAHQLTYAPTSKRAGLDSGYWHGPWSGLPGCAGADHCRRQVPLYVLRVLSTPPLRCWSSDISRIAYSHSGPRRMKRGVGGRNRTGADLFCHGRSRLKLYQLSYTNKEASYSQVTGGVVGPDKLSARNWLAFWRSVSWIIRRIKLRTKPRKGTRQSYQNPPMSQAEFHWF